MSDNPTSAETDSKPTLSMKLKFAMPYYAAVGQCASTWAFLENRIDLAILSFVKENTIPMSCALAQMFSIHAKVETLIAVAQSKKNDRASDQTIKRLVRFSHDLRPLSLQRNRIIHDPIMQDGDEVKILRLTTKGPKGSLQFELVPFELEFFSDFIRHTVDRADQFQKIREAMDADRREMQPSSQPEAPADRNP
jgi:hypothetical protein